MKNKSKHSVNRGLPIDTIVHNVVAALQNLDKRWEEVLTFPATIRFYTLLSKNGGTGEVKKTSIV